MVVELSHRRAANATHWLSYSMMVEWLNCELKRQRSSRQRARDYFPLFSLGKDLPLIFTCFLYFYGTGHRRPSHIAQKVPAQHQVPNTWMHPSPMQCADLTTRPIQYEPATVCINVCTYVFVLISACLCSCPSATLRSSFRFRIVVQFQKPTFLECGLDRILNAHYPRFLQPVVTSQFQPKQETSNKGKRTWSVENKHTSQTEQTISLPPSPSPPPSSPVPQPSSQTPFSAPSPG